MQKVATHLHHLKTSKYVLYIDIVPANSLDSKPSLFKRAFANNPSISFIETVEGLHNPMMFVVFEPEVVQYFNDSAGDYHGIATTLRQDLADEIFEDHAGVFFCTDIL